MKQYRRILSAALVLLAPPALAGADTVQQPAEIITMEYRRCSLP